MTCIGFDPAAHADEPSTSVLTTPPLKQIILVTHCEEGEGRYFRSIGLKDFKDKIVGFFDVGDPTHEPDIYTDSVEEYDPYANDGDDWDRVSLTKILERCGFGGQPVSKAHPEILRFKLDDKSSTSKYPTRIFEGAHDGSNDAYWTLRAAIRYCQQQADAQACSRVRPQSAWNEDGETHMRRGFLLVAVDFEATVNGVVRQAGIATIDSEDLTTDKGQVVAVDRWSEHIRVRSLVVDGLDDEKHYHPKCRPDSGPLYTHNHEVLGTAAFTQELRTLLTPSPCRTSSTTVIHQDQVS
ncbi:hypothetical protein J4E80_008881 [Alternaria sp. BMP 0032]|nr:hypothetical protein J4E80_008881 [Alternaria sp. BMP 0032]